MVKIRKFCCISRETDREQSSACQSSRDSSSGSHDYPWEVFSLKQLLQATNNFNENNKLGEGGFGAVYWGRTAAGGEIAVKRLKAMTAKAEMEFAVEVEVLGRVRHKNLLGLRGYFAGGSERLIIYDYMPNRSLLGHLHGRRPFDRLLEWRTRLRIALGSASGIAYLHHVASPHIIHRDIKASNVLLDSKFRPKVADFGFAKLIPDGVSHLTTRVKGTLGYLAPEYAMWGKVSESCDVYSFGILLLELVSGRKPIEKLPGGVKRTITEWAEPLISASRLPDIVDPRLHSVFDTHELRRILHAAARSVQSEPDRRPTMRQVLDVLTGTAPAADPVKNSRLSSVRDEDDGVRDVEEDDGGRASSAGRTSVGPGTLRMESIKYGQELMAMDDDNSNDGDVEDEDGERETTSTSSMEGTAVQKMREAGNYGQYDAGSGGRRSIMRG